MDNNNIKFLIRGYGAIGGASDSKSEGCEFESHYPPILYNRSIISHRVRGYFLIYHFNLAITLNFPFYPRTTITTVFGENITHTLILS